MQHFQAEPPNAQWCDWESTSEYDMDIDAEAEKLTSELQTRVSALHALQEQQLMGEDMA